MLKALPGAFVALLIAAGCVSVAPASNPPTTAPSAATTLGVTTPAPVTPPPTLAPTATPAPTVAPTVAPTLAPTVAPTQPPPTGGPTIAPTDVPSTEPTVAPPSGEPGTRDLLFNDDMTDPTSGWDTFSGDFATITYDTGVLAFRFSQNQAWASSPRNLDHAVSTLLVAADFMPDSDGIFGALCGESLSDTYYGAVVDTNGGLVFIQLANGTVNVLDRHDDLGLDVTLNASNPMAVECNVDVINGLSIIAGLANTGPVAAYHDNGGDHPLSFDVAGLYAESSNDSYTLAVDVVQAVGVGDVGGSMSDGANILLQHIPDALQNNCYESPQFSDAAEFKVTCIEQTSGKGAEIARYEQFADNDAMNAAYQDLVDVFGVESTGSCQTGPNEADWTVNEQTGGRVQCAPQGVGIRFDWTDDLTSILSALIDFQGSYESTYSQWQDAGPIIPQG